jgi:hypothetical protein
MPHYYTILNLTVCLLSDNLWFLDEFYKDYRCFKQTWNTEIPCDINIDLKDHLLQINEKCIDISDHPSPMHFAFQVVVSEIMSQLNDYYLIHAGVVQKDEHVIVLSGPPGIGKSTLVKTLVNNGFHFFSDDCAPLHKQSGMISPFPRSMWIVDKQNYSCSIRSKKNIPVTCTFDINTSVKPTTIICLIDDTSTSQPIQLNVSLKSHDSKFIKELKQFPDFQCIKRHSLHAEYRIQYHASETNTKVIQAAMIKYKKDLWTMYRVPPKRECFERKAKIKAVPTHQAAAEIISEMKMFESAFNPSFVEAPMATLINISKHIKDADCFIMSAGYLSSEIELIARVLNT